jgi:cytoskeletal protein CcmA (bactofilin family)
MFDRNKRETSSESGSFPAFETREPKEKGETRPHTREAAIIGPSIQISGDLSGEEDLVIQGKVTGTIQLREKSLTVGAQGQVNANVLAQSIIVEGEVKGDLYGSARVSIRKTGDVQGNIVSPKVSLDEGCRFKGSIDMDQEAINKAIGKLDTKSAVAKPDATSAKSKDADAENTAESGKPAAVGSEVKRGTAG